MSVGDKMNIPFNVKIYNDLKAEIAEGRYPEGMPLPTELQLQNRYGVSKAPVRQALGRLETEGLIIRKPGKGTFVNGNRMWRYIQLGGYSQEFMEKGAEVICKTLKVTSVKATKALREFFEEEKLETLVHIERYRSMDDKPYQYLEHYFKDVSKKALLEAGDIPDMPAFLETQGLVPYTVKEELEAIAMPEKLAQRCGMEPGIPVMKVTRLAFGADNRLYEYMVYYTDSVGWKYRVQYKI